jgi:hypothetical protein
VNTAALQPRHHNPPEGWDEATFEALTDALAGALVAAYRRRHTAETEASAVRGRDDA